MAAIFLDKISVEFPVYNINARSFKKNFLHLATGGNVSRDANEHIVVRALHNISLTIHHGDRVGLVGHNGSGKSTFLKLLSKIYEPSKGRIHIDGEVSPMLDIMHGIEAEFTGLENIFIRGTILGLSKKEIEARIPEIAAFAGLGDYLRMPVRTYSSGMKVRLAFSISTSINPDILLIDEVFGTGDSEFIERARAKRISLVNDSSIVVMATHSDELIREFCNKVLLLEGGTIQYFGDTERALQLYRERRQTQKV